MRLANHALRRHCQSWRVNQKTSNALSPVEAAEAKRTAKLLSPNISWLRLLNQ